MFRVFSIKPNLLFIMSYFLRNVLFSLLNAFEIELELLNSNRENYNPKTLKTTINLIIDSNSIKNKKNEYYLQDFNYISLYIVFFVIFYCFPIWFLIIPLRFPLKYFLEVRIFTFDLNTKNITKQVSRACTSLSEFQNEKKIDSIYDSSNFNWTTKIGLYCKNSKFQIRQFLTDSSKIMVSTKGVFGWFPIVCGISNILYTKHQDDIFLNLFQHTLPGISVPNTQISWVTFEQTFSNEFKWNDALSSSSNIFHSYVKGVDFYSDTILIKPNQSWYTKQQKVSIATFTTLKPTRILSKTQIGNNWYRLFLETKPEHNFLIKNKNNKNWNFFCNYSTKSSRKINESSKTLSIFNNFNPKNQNTYVSDLDELPSKLHSNYIDQESFFQISLKKKAGLKKIKFFQKKKPTSNKKILKNGVFSNSILFFPSNKVSLWFHFFDLCKNNQNTNNLLNQIKKQKKVQIKVVPFEKLKKNESYQNFRILRGIQNPDKQNTIDYIEPKFSHFAASISNKTYFLETTLKQNLSEKNFIPLSKCIFVNPFLDLLKNPPSEYTLHQDIKYDIIALFESLYFQLQSLDITEIQELLELIEQNGVFYENYFISPHTMSGYRLADTCYSDNFSLISQFFYKKNSKLINMLFFPDFPSLSTTAIQINLSKNFSFSRNLSHKISETPLIPQHKNTTQIDFMDFDELKIWIKQFLNSDTVSTDRRETFFGKNVYAKKRASHAISKKNQNYFSDKFQDGSKPPSERTLYPSIQLPLPILNEIKVALLRKGRVRVVSFFETPLKPVITVEDPKKEKIELPYHEIKKPIPTFSCNSYLEVTHLTKSEWNKFIKNFLNIKKLSRNKTSFNPFFYSQLPKQKFSLWPLNQSNLSSVSPTIFSYLKNLNIVQPSSEKAHTSLENDNFFHFRIKYHYFPYSQTLLKEIFPKNSFFGKKYISTSSIYNGQKSQKIESKHLFKRMYKVVEPITGDSWLFVTQISIGLLFLSILESLFQKYGKELTTIFSNLLLGNNQNEDSPNLFGTDEHDNFRLMQNIQKNFRDIAGIDAILPELSEIVWVLRNSGRSFTVGNAIPRRILLTGPPGTGKTLAVQAIAGEAEVPVLIESGSSLSRPEKLQTGSERVKTIFKKAREIAPCILFIDEIDTFGEARDQMVHHYYNDSILDLIYPNKKNKTGKTLEIGNLDFIPRRNISVMKNTSDQDESFDFEENSSIKSPTDLVDKVNQRVVQDYVRKSKKTREKSNLLLQFLIELDGMTRNNKVFVFAATNRPQILDAALTRPGRFNKVIHLSLPNKQKRIEILKLYSKNLGVSKTISWNYLANLARGLSAADLASVMNQSAMKAIQAETVHTIETIEYGIECITGSIIQKNQLKSFIYKSKNASKYLFLSRLAYYQSGKAIVQTLLKYHPSVVSIHLWPQLKNLRYNLINGILETEFSQINTRIELESRIIGFYGGKAAELLALFHGFKNRKYSFQEKIESEKSILLNQISKQQKFLYFWQSDLGVQDIRFAGWVAQLMISKWYFYSKKVSIRRLYEFQNNNYLENKNDPITSEILKQLAYETQIQTEMKREMRSRATSSRRFRSTRRSPSMKQKRNFQNFKTKFWIEKQITKKLELIYEKKTFWFRIYDAEHKQNESNQWVASDEYYHNNPYLKNLLHIPFQRPSTLYSFSVEKQSKNNLKPDKFNQSTQKLFFKSYLPWSDVTTTNLDYIYHSLILNCFNKSIFILDDNRELLDFFASYLLQKEVIREHEITHIIQNFQKKKNTEQTKNPDKNKNENKEKITAKNTFVIVSKEMVCQIESSHVSKTKWLRKKFSRFLSFERIKNI